ncbi:TadE/TadG family type IV pilus assembly protein [Bosea sp. (in: a-proteobacteria)]|jgi:Flp pilus assembly protein TadG|uniref:TadE/TadG family type IV pilus assembly protein n=1 Tax=Bosea sp. (in: a-proteobacteria) TaxID=1871050 RepID=UPI003F712162
MRIVTRLIRDNDAASAVEFAFVAPVLLLMTFGIIGYGYVLGVYHGVQQIAAEAARASVSGLNDSERARIARDFVTANITSYAFIDPARIKVTTRSGNAPQQTFEVTVAYDMSGSLFDSLSILAPLPQPMIERRAVIQRGGY